MATFFPRRLKRFRKLIIMRCRETIVLVEHDISNTRCIYAMPIKMPHRSNMKMRYEQAWSSDGLHSRSYAMYVHGRRPTQWRKGRRSCSLVLHTRNTPPTSRFDFSSSFVQCSMSELDDIFSSIQGGVPPSMSKKRRHDSGDNTATKSSSSKTKKKSKSHTTTSSDASKALTQEKVSSSSTSQSSTSHIPSSSKAAVPVVVHDDTSAKHQSKSARKPPPPKDDADVAFADSRGKDRAYHNKLTQANAPRKDTVCLLKMNSS